MSAPVVAAQETSRITPCQTFEGHAEWISGVIHLPGGERIMTCSSDGSLRVWNMKSGEQIGDKWQDGENPVRMIALSPDGKTVVSGSRDGAVRLWDIDTGKVIAKWVGHTEGIGSVCWSRNGQRVLSGSYDGTAREWDVEKGETALGPIETGYQLVWAAIYSPDMTMIATAGGDLPLPGFSSEYPIKIWDAKTGELVTTLNGHTMFCLAWTMDRKTLISGSYYSDHSIRTWSTKTWKHIAVLEGHTDHVFSIAISSNGRILASASSDNTVRLWNLETSQPISSHLHHADKVISLSFSADGKQLTTACYDKNAYLWDVSAILKEAGLEDLLLDKRDKSTINVTRRPVQPIKVLNRVPQGFFDGSPVSNRAHRSARDSNDTPSHQRLFQWARDLFSGVPHGRGSAAADVPYAKGKRRNASARERRKPIMTNATASSSRPPNSNTTLQSSGAAQVQSQGAVSTSTAPPVAANTAPSTNPHVIIKHAGRWTRFWLFICCTSSEYTDGHH
ncbi:hypothetical protein CY34DRAFT_812948 [Suillus luteus UH-Slu-Lm8-n1]|uniref:WD40 repeat-like protein n=1 Tax=Suillus luteus UH-Slu-Lm8-n1 TaxID=930992 RepID=A0A0D0A8D5_9AGAM|nr:hypothetical protein CY34DRAFT_812948 [Suillus luteus UH-Slu-Lm8-n1]